MNKFTDDEISTLKKEMDQEEKDGENDIPDSDDPRY